MSFYDTIEAALNEGREIMTRRAWFFDINDRPLRLWEGNGRVHAGGEWWHGTMRGEQNFFEAPRLSDGRKGDSPLYEFRLGYLQPDDYEAIKADEAVIKDRPLICYRLYFADGEGARALTDPLVIATLTMKGRFFKQTRVRDENGFVLQYSVGVRARDGNEGQSEAPYAYVTDTEQNARAQSFGVPVDRYARFVASLVNKSVTLKG